MTRLFHFTDVWFYSTAQRGSEVATQKGGKRQGKQREAQRKNERYITAPSVAAGLVCARKCMQSTAVVCVCLCICVTYISVMVSGRLVGISVSPFPLQSTMLLLQVQDSGHCNTLQEEDDDDW